MSADFLTTLPSQVIIDVMEKYFNEEMYRKPVKVLELKTAGDMYSFELEWADNDEKPVSILPNVHDLAGLSSKSTVGLERASNGKFMRKAVS